MEAIMQIETLIGMPEADAALPFAMIADVGENVFVLTGLAGGTGNREKPDLLAMNQSEASGIVEKLKEKKYSFG